MDVPKDNSIVYFGKTNFRGKEQVFGIRSDNEDRFQHMYVIGQTGTGKSTLLKNLAIQDIRAGRGLALVDPHGEFVEDLLEHIPPERQKDVIYFNPADTEYPVGFNVLEVKSTEYKHLVSSGLMAIFTKIWANVWSSRMEYILSNAVLALLDTPNMTLLGIPRLLVDKQFRREIVDNIQDPVVKAYWVTEYEQYQDKFRTEAIAPIQNKVGQFLSTHLIRNIVGQPKSTLDIERVMNESKILLANVSKGRIGEDNSALIGAMLITKIQLTAMERVKIANIADRKPFLLFVDEFQNFATDSFASVLSEARKYRLGLVISHQFIGQLVTDTSTKVRDAIFGNVGTMITFRVGAPDAEFLEKQYAPDLVMEDLVNLPNRSIYLKLMIDGLSSRPFSAGTLAPIHTDDSPVTKAQVIENSRQQFAKPRAQVEQEIAEWSGMFASSTPGGSPQDDFRKPQRESRDYPSDRPRRPTSSQGSYTNRPARAPYPDQDYQDTRPYRERDNRDGERSQSDRPARPLPPAPPRRPVDTPQRQTMPMPPRADNARPENDRPRPSQPMSLHSLAQREPQPFKRSSQPSQNKPQAKVDTDSLRQMLKNVINEPTRPKDDDDDIDRRER